MLQDIIDEIKMTKRERPSELLERLIKERLQLAVINYYADLSRKLESYTPAIEYDVVCVARRLIK